MTLEKACLSLKSDNLIPIIRGMVLLKFLIFHVGGL